MAAQSPQNGEMTHRLSLRQLRCHLGRDASHSFGVFDLYLWLVHRTRTPALGTTQIERLEKRGGKDAIRIPPTNLQGDIRSC